MNINDKVWVKLTPAGRRVLSMAKYPYSIYGAGEGWSEWQLWTLMNIFGKHLYVGNSEVYFEKDEILLHAPKLTL